MRFSDDVGFALGGAAPGSRIDVKHPNGKGGFYFNLKSMITV